MYDPFRAKLKVALYTAAAALMGLGIASTIGWGGVSYSMPVIGSEPQIPIEAVQPALDLSDAFVSVAEVERRLHSLNRDLWLTSDDGHRIGHPTPPEGGRDSEPHESSSRSV